MTPLHVMMYKLIPDFQGMPLVKMIIIEMMTTIIECHGSDINTIDKVSCISNSKY